MDQDKALRVAVVGQFSSGKSALINALLGEEIAPMGVTPVTAVLHRFRWSEERNAVVENLDGTIDKEAVTLAAQSDVSIIFTANKKEYETESFVRASISR